MKHILHYILIISATIAIGFYGCRKEEFETDSKFALEFSTDTVIFDTVFTSIGSVTKSLVVHNNSKKKINISKITLARGVASPFRLNIDGSPAENYTNLEIGANDSAYIFVKVTIDPKNASNPLIESDSIVFQTNGNSQNVKLVAWGQDAYFHLNEVLTGDVTLPDDKPHVIYGTLTAAKNCALKINAGTRLYFHHKASLDIRKGASLLVSGILKSPVIFTSDRLDDERLNDPGLWKGIWLENGSLNTSFTYAEITNAVVGIQADSCGLVDGQPLKLHNCMINNTLNYCILATKAKIIATNCQITNSGGNVISIQQGGDYDFRNCTLSQHLSNQYPALSISNYSYDTSGKFKVPGELFSAYFGNCIINGSSSSEIDFYELAGIPFNFKFDQCLVDWDKNSYKGKNYETRFVNCIPGKGTIFIAPRKNNFQLDTLSVAIDAASLNIINTTVPDITFDRKGISRITPGPPDLGAYERVEKKKNK